MAKLRSFIEEINASYRFAGSSIDLGAAVYGGDVLSGTTIRLPLATLNRHGLIAGDTGTGKTKTLQILAEQLSWQGVPSLVMDMKGDLSGVAMPGVYSSRIQERHEAIGLIFEAGGSPVEFLSLSDELGVRLRATVTEFGPILLSRILGLNATQQGVMALVFKYCDDQGLALVDLDDLKRALQWLTGPGKGEMASEYGTISSQSMGAIVRKLVELEQQSADLFFGERSFDVDDLLRTDEQGRGYISIVRLTDLQDRPHLFSTFMLQMMAELFESFPEVGDLPKPKLVLFIDEAHLVFRDSTAVLVRQIETVVRLIRSKGIAVIFVTQSPTDVPGSVLGQLGMKIQHALRAFTAKDRRDIKLAAQNFPISPHYDVEALMTSLGTGEALVTALDERGRPTTLAHTMLRAPQSRMDILSPEELNYFVRQSALVPKYRERVNRETANEMLRRRMAQQQAEPGPRVPQRPSAAKPAQRRATRSVAQRTIDTASRQLGRTLAMELSRGLLGILTGRKTRR